MKYADEIKGMLDNMSTNLHEKVRIDVIEQVQHHIKQMFVKHMKDRASIVFDATIKEPKYEAYTDTVLLAIPKMYYYSLIKWITDNGFRVHFPTKEIDKLNTPYRVTVIVQL